VKADPVQLQVLAHLETIPNSGHIALFHDKPPLGITLTPHVIALRQAATWQKKLLSQHVIAQRHVAKRLFSSCFYSYILFIIVMNILIIRDILLNIENGINIRF
jgi:hypothetical protein